MIGRLSDENGSSRSTRDTRCWTGASLLPPSRAGRRSRLIRESYAVRTQRPLSRGTAPCALCACPRPVRLPPPMLRPPAIYPAHFMLCLPLWQTLASPPEPNAPCEWGKVVEQQQDTVEGRRVHGVLSGCISGPLSRCAAHVGQEGQDEARQVALATSGAAPSSLDLHVLSPSSHPTILTLPPQ